MRAETAARSRNVAHDQGCHDAGKQRQHKAGDEGAIAQPQPDDEVDPEQNLKGRQSQRDDRDEGRGEADAESGNACGEVGGMADFEQSGGEEDAAQSQADEERHHMSSRTKQTAHRQSTTGLRGRRLGAVLAVVVAVVAVAGIILYAVLNRNQAVPGAATTAAPILPPPLTVGSQAPTFTLRSSIGTFSSSQLAGKPYLLEIFATWCPHCQRMTRVLREIRRVVPASRLAMISVTGSPYASTSTPDQLVPENQADVDAFEAAFHVTWPTFFDPDLTVAKTWGLDGFPTIFIVNAKGTIVYVASGEVPAATLLRAITKAGA
jgi:thiol-disulfide isomerase/thioredoxin